jgi:glycosyltransferase
LKVSVITSVFNNSEFIQSCIDSVASQDYPDIEYIVIDGASTDGTSEIINKNSSVISKFFSAKDSGMYDGLNKGIAAASGDVICFLHSDDLFYDSHIISKVIEAFNKTNADCVYGDLVYVSKNDPRKVIRYWKAGSSSTLKIISGWMPPHPALFIKKKIYDSFGSFRTDFSIAADYDIILRFFGKHKISSYYLPEVLIKMRTGGKSNSSLSNILKKSGEDMRALTSNRIGLGLITLLFKNLRKIPQFINNKRL